MSEYTLFVCLGGTGTQVGTAIGNLYPLLRSSGIAGESSVYNMFIMDKDTKGNHEYCVDAAQRYQSFYNTLPFETLAPYTLTSGLYHELQKKANKFDTDYTVIDLIGSDDPIKALAGMCWEEEKYTESLRYGNNRDPSRGSLDAHVCLKYFTESSLFKTLTELVNGASVNNIRLVIIGGTTGGMGSSLIVPLVQKIKAYRNSDDSTLKNLGKIRIDLVILGSYFKIPNNPDDLDKVNDIGVTNDSYYRVRDQVQELEKLVSEYGDDQWRVYYVACQGFDDICGSFNKNGAEKRKAHLVELLAAGAALQLQPKGAGFYQTSIPTDEEGSLKIGWEEIPLGISDGAGAKLKNSARNLMRLISVMACQVYPRFCQDIPLLQKDVYVTTYIKKPKDNKKKIDALSVLIKAWLGQLIPYFEFWNDIQLYSKLGGGNSIAIEFFDRDAMNTLSAILANVINNPAVAWRSDGTPVNQMPLCKDTWMNYLSGISPARGRLATATASEDKSEDLFSLMIEDLYQVLSTKKED